MFNSGIYILSHSSPRRTSFSKYTFLLVSQSIWLYLRIYLCRKVGIIENEGWSNNDFWIDFTIFHANFIILLVSKLKESIIIAFIPNRNIHAPDRVSCGRVTLWMKNFISKILKLIMIQLMNCLLQVSCTSNNKRCIKYILGSRSKNIFEIWV